MSVGTILLIILVIALLGGFSGIGGGRFYGGTFASPHLGAVVLYDKHYWPLHELSRKQDGVRLGAAA
jgi:hypothetical protein